jgi:hypothetical protein
MEITRLMSSDARDFFASAIEDVEQMREFLNEKTKSNKPERDFSSLDEMSQT